MRAFAIRDSLEARERTREVFDSDAEDAEDDDNDMSSLDGSSSNEDAEEAADYEEQDTSARKGRQRERRLQVVGSAPMHLPPRSTVGILHRR